MAGHGSGRFHAVRPYRVTMWRWTSLGNFNALKEKVKEKKERKNKKKENKEKNKQTKKPTPPTL